MNFINIICFLAALTVIAAPYIVYERVAFFFADFELHKLGVKAAEQINISSKITTVLFPLN
jgi:hypothetical protein